MQSCVYNKNGPKLNPEYNVNSFFLNYQPLSYLRDLTVTRHLNRTQITGLFVVFETK